jgi:hypothetical protein
MSRRRPLLLCALACAFALALTATATADTTLKLGYRTLPAPNSDCMVHAALMRGANGSLYGSGNTYCSQRKLITTATTHLKTPAALIDALTTSFTNSFGMGSRWLNTRGYSGCNYWQVVTSTTVTDTLGRASSTYATSDTPLWAC